MEGTIPLKLQTQLLLNVEDLVVRFRTEAGWICAVDGLSYEVRQGEILAIVGESGSGKSVSARTLMGLLRGPNVKVSGRITYRDSQLLDLSQKAHRNLCSREIALVPQDPLSSLNPVFSVGWQIAELFRVHEGLTRNKARDRAQELMDRVHIPDARSRMDDYPHQFSGGMRQRILIAMAIALKPTLLIADEPTTALDVTTQAQILDLLEELRRAYGLSMILITHDLGVVAEVADRALVMYGGRAMEIGRIDVIFQRSAHPYTKALRESLPRLGVRDQNLTPIAGTPLTAAAEIPGCKFHPRCAWATPECAIDVPPLRKVSNRLVACHHAEEVFHC